MKGVLMRSWTYNPRPDRTMYWTTSGYFAQYTQNAWAPLDDETSTKYIGLDFCVTYAGDTNPIVDDFITVSFQRAAKVYLMVHAYRGNGAKTSLTGWRAEGYVTRVKGDGKTKFDIGTQKRDIGAPGRAYVFSKVVESSVTIGSRGWVGCQR